MLKSSLPITRPVRIAADFSAAEIVDVDFTLHDLFMACARNGERLIQGKTIRGCRIQGPAVLLASNGVTFTDVNFGDSRGEMGNLLTRSLGAKAIGSIPMRDCAFVSCEFHGVGFTGDDAFLEQMQQITGTPRPYA